jgi:GntR family transcriptional regulator, rspAB operon transcriptional repressor
MVDNPAMPPERRRDRAHPLASSRTDYAQQRAATPRAATHIYKQLLEEIISLRRKPMEPILEKEIAAQFGVSRTPVHQAVLRLADDGLIDIFPQSGTFVSRIPRRALYEAILIRKSLEETTVKLAAEQSEATDIVRLERTIADMAAAETSGNNERFHAADTDFHLSINSIAGFPGIWNVIQQVKMQIDRYRRLTLPLSGRLTRVIAEHEAILDGIRRHDVAHATEAMGFHLGQMLGEVKDATNVDPAFFIDDD